MEPLLFLSYFITCPCLYLLHVYMQLARQGLNVVIMSRSEEKLQKVANEISECHSFTNRINSIAPVPPPMSVLITTSRLCL